MNRQAFPSRVPLGLLLGFFVAVMAIVPCIAVFRMQQEPIRAYYLKTYLRASFLPGSKTDKPQLFQLVIRGTKDSEGSSSACQVTTPLWLPSRAESVDREAVETAGKCVLVTTPGQMKTWLQGTVYQGETCAEVLQFPLTVWAALVFCFMSAGGLCDAQRKGRARRGIQIRGPELVTRWRFNQLVQGDGFPIVLENKRNLLEMVKGQAGKVLRIRRRDENKNIICMSDPGGGKTSILMQILDEVERRG